MVGITMNLKHDMMMQWLVPCELAQMLLEISTK